MLRVMFISLTYWSLSWIRKHRETKEQTNLELDGMFDLLEQVGEEGERSFYTTRRAEFEHLCGDNGKAMDLIERAVKRTPKLFEPRRLHAEILLKAGNLAKANEVIGTMERMVNSRDPDEGREGPFVSIFKRKLTT